MSEVTLTITLDAYCSYVTEADLIDHLREIAADIEGYAKGTVTEDWYRKYQVDYETQEDINLSMTTDTRTTP